MRVLFVDDEVRVFEALERALFDSEPRWQTAFARRADSAFVELSKHAYDVVVSDLRLSGIDGVRFLSRVRELHPRAVRIVLSAHGDALDSLMLVRVAHQFIAKPCAAETLRQVIARTQDLNRVLGDHKLQSIAGRVDTLLPAPELRQRLLQLLEPEEANAAELAALIKQDPAITSKLLQIANSAFFDSAASVVDIETAVQRLGPLLLRDLTLGLGVFAVAAGGSDAPATSVEEIQRHSLAIARTAAGMARLPEDASVAYIAGLLCDVGQLVLASTVPERLYVAQAEARQARVPAHVAEQATWGATHAELGAYLLGIWGLPFQLVEAVANHHSPERHAEEQVGLAQLVWLAACIVDGEEPQAEHLHRFGAEELYAGARAAFEAAGN